jgi:hypothetical protein
MFVFLGLHFAALGVLEHVMNAFSICTAETQSLSCVLFTFCVKSLNFYWSKIGLICSPTVMYSAWKPDISETSKSKPVMLSLPLHLQSIYNKGFETCYTLTLQGPIRRCLNFH